MKGEKFPQANMTLGPPEGMSEEECLSLPTHFDSDRHLFTACFALEPSEMEAIASTGKIWLQVMARAFPPVCLRLDNPFEPDGIVQEAPREDQVAVAAEPKKKSTGRIYEQMVRVRVGTRIVRGWLRAHEYADGTELAEREAEFIKVVSEVLAISGGRFDYAKRIADLLDYVNAVEILDPSGNGALAYNDWP